MTTIGCSISSIPLDLMIEIFLKLPAKSVVRFKCVSKTWCSIICSQQFIDAFMSLSLSRPRLVFVINDRVDDRVFFLCSPRQNSSLLSSYPMLERYKLTFQTPIAYLHYIFNSVRGFNCCCQDDRFMVYNLTTGQVIPLGENNSDNDCYMYLGYNPNNDQYKVLRLMFRMFSDSPIEHSVRTLGNQQSSNSWRPIKTSIVYCHCYESGVCIDGVVYYEYKNDYKTVVSSFDVGSEQLRLIETPEDLTGDLTNYIGKLAVHHCFDNEIILWVLDDFKNQVWSKKTYILQFSADFILSKLYFMGITTFGEIVYVPREFYDSFEFFCYDVEKKTGRAFMIKGFQKGHRFCPSVICSYVDNIIYL